MCISAVRSAQTGGQSGKPRRYITYQRVQEIGITVQQELPPGNSHLVSVLVGKDAGWLSNNQFC